MDILAAHEQHVFGLRFEIIERKLQPRIRHQCFELRRRKPDAVFVGRLLHVAVELVEHALYEFRRTDDVLTRFELRTLDGEINTVVLHVLGKRIRERDDRLRLRAVADTAPCDGNHRIVGHLLAILEGVLVVGRLGRHLHEELGIIGTVVEVHLHRLAVDLGVQIGRLAREAGTAVEGRSRSGDRRHLVEQPRGQRFERRTTLEHLLDIRTSDHRIEEPFGKRFERRAVREHRQSGRYVSHVFQQAGRKAFERCTAIEHVSDRNGIRTTRREIIRRNRRHGRTTSPKRSHIRDVRKFGQRREIGHFHTVFEEIGGIHGLG